METNNYSRKIKTYANIIWKVGLTFSIIIAGIGFVAAIISEGQGLLILLLSFLISGFLLFIFWILKIFFMGYSIIVRNNEEAIEEREIKEIENKIK